MRPISSVALGALDDRALRAPSRLDGWSRLTIACRLPHGGREPVSPLPHPQRGNPCGVRLGTGPPAYVTIKIMRAARRAPVVARAGLVA